MKFGHTTTAMSSDQPMPVAYFTAIHKSSLLFINPLIKFLLSQTLNMTIPLQGVLFLKYKYNIFMYKDPFIQKYKYFHNPIILYKLKKLKQKSIYFFLPVIMILLYVWIIPPKNIWHHIYIYFYYFWIPQTPNLMIPLQYITVQRKKCIIWKMYILLSNSFRFGAQ